MESDGALAGTGGLAALGETGWLLVRKDEEYRVNRSFNIDTIIPNVAPILAGTTTHYFGCHASASTETVDDT